MRILLVYPSAAYAVLDVATGCHEALMELGHEVRPFDYSYILAYHGYAVERYIEISERFRDSNPPGNAHQVLASEHIAIECLDFGPDIALFVCGVDFHPRGLELLHVLGIPTALILTESPYHDDGIQGLMVKNGGFSIVFTNERESVPVLSQKRPDIPIRYLPHSYRPKMHRPVEVASFYRSEVFFHGTSWPGRKELFDAAAQGLQRLGIWPHFAWAQYKEDEDGGIEVVGAILNRELVLWYSGAMLAVNHHKTPEDGVKVSSANPRTFEIAGCGVPQLVDDSRAEVREIFGDSVAYYDSVDSFVACASGLVHADKLRAEMRAEATERVAQCTFRHRMEQVLIPALEEVI